MRYSQFKYIIVILLFFTVASNAQQFPIYSQYMMNGFLLNPAVAGHEGYTAINLTVRDQWAGLSGTPKTYALSAQTRILKNSFIFRHKSVRHRRKSMSKGGKVGLGGYIFNDVNGIFSRTGFQGTYAYHLTLRRSQLSFGVSLTGFQYKIDKGEIKVNENDQYINDYQSSAFIPDANLGVYYSDRYLYAGLSAQNLFQSYIKFNDSKSSEFKLDRQYLLTAGYRFDVVDFIFI
jgi:type IX secretion system PorP/SprF family membrane protein